MAFSALARFGKGVVQGAGELARKTAPVGPSIREAAESAAEEGLDKNVLPKDVQPPPKPTTVDETGAAVDEAAEAAEETAEREFKPVTDEEAGEVVQSVGKPRPDPETQTSNTNFDRWDTQEEMEAMWETSAKQIDEDGGAGKRMSHEEMITKAKRAGYGKDPVGWMLRQLETGQVDIETLPGQMVIARETAVELGEELYSQAKRISDAHDAGKSIDQETLLEFEINQAKFRSIQEVVAKHTRLAGQLLGSFKYLAKNQGRVRFKQVAEAIESAGGAETITQRAQNIANNARRADGTPDLAKLSGEVSDSFLTRAAHIVEGVRYNNMLSGMGTAIRNIVGNLMHNGYIITTQGAGAASGSLRNLARKATGRQGPQVQVTISDWMNGTRAMSYSILESLALGVKSWADPKLQISNRGKVEVQRQATLKGGKAAQWLEKVFGLPGRGLVEMVDLMYLTLGTRNLASGDVFFKNAIWRFETHMLAHQTARLEGLTGDAATARINEILTGPLPEDVFEKGMNAAAVGTHTQEPKLATLGKNFMNLRNTPGAGGHVLRIAVPFARVLVNIMTWSAKEATLPAHTAFSKELRQAIKHQTREGQEYVGRLGVYTALFTYVGHQATEGNITGTGRYADARTLRFWRSLGWQPMSIRYKNEDGTHTYKSFAQLQPFGTLIAWMADTTDIVNYYGDDDWTGSDILQGAGDSLKVLAAGPFEAPFVKGLYDWMSVAFEERSTSKILKNVFSQYAGPPAWLRDIEKTMDPNRSQTYGHDLLDEMANRFEAGMPGFSVDMPPRLTPFGEIAKQGASPWNVMPTTTIDHGDVVDEVINNGVFFAVPRDHMINVGGQEVSLLGIDDPRGEGWAMHEYQKILGQARLKHLRNMINQKGGYGDSGYKRAIEGEPGSDTATRVSKGTLLNKALTFARREAHERFANRYKGSDFHRAYNRKKIPQDDVKPPHKPAHIRADEREQAGVNF
jgi:hypothetical protein